MKKLFILLLLVGSLFADSTTNKNTIDCEKIIKYGDKELIAKRGCCSWHGGVCNCGSKGRVICCDGTYSPSCTCKGGKSLIKETTGNKS